MKLFIAVLMVLSFQAQTVLANSSNLDIVIPQDLTSTLGNIEDNVRNNRYNWDMLGCVEAKHDCDNMANIRGYHHHKAKRSHDCKDNNHHKPFACYGRN